MSVWSAFTGTTDAAICTRRQSPSSGRTPDADRGSASATRLTLAAALAIGCDAAYSRLGQSCNHAGVSLQSRSSRALLPSIYCIPDIFVAKNIESSQCLSLGA